MRSYIVIPEGTSIVRVDAATPHFAASKAKRGKGETLDVTQAAVFPMSAAIRITGEGPSVIPGQMSWSDHGEAVEV
jgi:hypothetical protein